MQSHFLFYDALTLMERMRTFLATIKKSVKPKNTKWSYSMVELFETPLHHGQAL